MNFDIRNLLFNISGFRPETELEKTLLDKNLSLEEYLLKEEAIQCFKDMKDNAQKYFDRNKIKQLIKYITEEPKEDEYNIGYKYPYVASQMLKSADERIQEMIIFPEEEFNKKYYKQSNDKIDNKSPENENNSENEIKTSEEKNQDNMEEAEEHKDNEIKEEKKGKNLVIEISDSNDSKERNKKLEENSLENEKNVKKDDRKFNIDKHSELLDLLLDFITKDNEKLNDVLCGYFVSVILSLLNKYPIDMFLYLLYIRQDAFEQIVLHSYQNSLMSISSKILKFDNYYTEIENKIKISPEMLNFELFKAKFSSFNIIQSKLLEKIITSIDLNGMKGQNGNYMEGINIENIFVMLNELLDDPSIFLAIIKNKEIVTHLFKILAENIFDYYTNLIDEKKKYMYNFFIIFLKNILYYKPKMDLNDNDNLNPYPEFNYSIIFEKIKNKQPLMFDENLIITIPKILSNNYKEISKQNLNSLGLHNIYIIDLVIKFFYCMEQKPTLFDFIILESGFMDKSITYFFNYKLNNIYHSKFVKLFDLYLQNSQNHPLLTDYFFNKKKFHLMLLDYVDQKENKKGKPSEQYLYIYVIDLIYKIQAASGLKLLDEKDKKELNILNFGYFEFIKDEKASKDIINLKIPKYVTDILQECKQWMNTMENKIIPLIKKYEGKLCFEKGIKQKELTKMTVTQGLLNSLISLISKNKKSKEEPISNYDDVNFWKMKNTIPEEVKNKVNSNIKNNNNSNNDDNDDEDELLNIAMNLEKQEEENKAPKNKNVSFQPKIQIISTSEINSASNTVNTNNNEVKTDSGKGKDGNKKEKQIKEENKLGNTQGIDNKPETK